MMERTPCLKCGRSGSPVQITGLIETTMTICDACFDAAVAGLDVLRVQFDELIVAGVPRDEANSIMIARIDGAPQS